MQIYDYVDLEVLGDTSFCLLQDGCEHKINLIRDEILNVLQYTHSDLVRIVDDALEEELYDTLLQHQCLHVVGQETSRLLAVLCLNLTTIRAVAAKKHMRSVLFN